MNLGTILLTLQNAVSAQDTTAISKKEEVITAIKSMSIEDMTSKLVDGAVTLGIRLVIAIIVFYLGQFIIKRLYKFSARVLEKRGVEASLSSFLLSLLRIVLLFILVISIVGILGIETSSFVAIFASAGVAIGLALSGTLQNFAGGVLILLTKPYRVGDYIEYSGLSGSVKEIQIFSTIINTPDNKTIIIPNGGLATGIVNNYSTEIYRRVDWTFTISYGDDMKVARDTILEVLNADERVVKTTCAEDYKKRPQEAKLKLSGIIPTVPQGDCSPKVFLNELAADSVNIVVKAWVHSSLYWGVYYDVNEIIYKVFPEKGLNFPFPQLDVRINKEN